MSILVKARVNRHWLFFAAVAIGALVLAFKSPPVADRLIPPIAGIIWQPHEHNLNPSGNWHHLGTYQLLVQWSKVDNRSFLPCPGEAVSCELNDAQQAPPPIPDWAQIGREPWAREVIMGLVGRFKESEARSSAVDLAEEGAISAIAPPGVNVVGWYFPVEFDPTWDIKPSLIDALALLPRPLWVSVYDSANVGPEQLVMHLQRWLPADVGIFWQDGVGVHAREASISAQYIRALIDHLGANRVRVIAEAFRPDSGGGFRAATAKELIEQLAHYNGHTIYLFEGPTYITPELLSALVSQPQTIK